MKVAIDEVFHFGGMVHDPATGALIDADSTPTFVVLEEATDTDIGVGGNMTKRTSLTGRYRGTFTASAANGFEAGKWYEVDMLATVGGAAAGAIVAYFQCAPAETIAGVPKVDVSHLLGTAWLTPGTAGTPDVNAKLWNGLTTVALPATPTNITAGTITTVTTLTNLPAITANWLTATGVATGALTAAKFAAGAIDAAALAADAGTEIGTAVWATTTRLLTAGTNIALAKGTGVTGFTDLSAAQVNTEVVDALNVDTYAEPAQGTPGATLSLAAKINYVFKAWRNRNTQTASQYSLYGDDATTVHHKATFSDNATTADRGEVATGP